MAAGGASWYLLQSIRFLAYSLRCPTNDAVHVCEAGGARRIDTLGTFPIHWHPNLEAMKESLVVRGQRFANLIGLHHQHYDGHAFFQRKDGIVRLPVDSRIVVDAEQFRKSNPSYPRLFTQKSSSSVFFDLGSATEQADSEQVMSKGVAPGDLDKDALLICAPTVLAFSLGDKFWGEAHANMIHDNRADRSM